MEQETDKVVRVVVEIGARRGAWLDPFGEFACCVWVPRAKQVELRIVAPEERLIPLVRTQRGYWTTEANDIHAGARYFYRLDGHLDRPDPASRSQPAGVHGPSEVIDERFAWSDQAWRGRPLSEMVIYELHTGAFSATGTFAGIIDKLDELVALGINTIEVMPIAQFPGERNWGYDGVFPYAAQHFYGGRREFQRLVNECHARGLAVMLDVVYNHLGPEGNYLADFGPYFTDRYRTPWGLALNFDGPDSAEVRQFFIRNAIEWVVGCHVDGLRLDAVHAIFDNSERHILRQLADEVHEIASELGRHVVLIAETNMNDPQIVTPAEQGGLGMDGQWPDDFSRSLQGLLTGEHEGYYADYGTVEHFAKAYREAFVLTGQHSKYRGGQHGQSAAHLPADRFVVCVQNHDQVGNRAGSERLSQLVDFDSLKLAAAAVILSPYVPLLFMGEEYAEPAPFNYFIDHTDRALCKAVHRGRIAEFIRHAWQSTPPHPKAARTFEASRLNHDLKQHGQHKELWHYYQTLLKLRQQHSAIRAPRRDQAEVICPDGQSIMLAHRWCEGSEVLVALNFSHKPVVIALPDAKSQKPWRVVFQSAVAPTGSIAARSAMLLSA